MKEACRKEARQAREDFFKSQSEQALKALEQKRIDQFFSLASVQKVLDKKGCVGVYHALGSEASTVLLIDKLHRNGMGVALPRVEAERMVFHTYQAGDDLLYSSFGICEPMEGAPQIVPDLYVMPLLAFDGNNHRLGYGKGHYDRYFAAHPDGLKIGWAYPCQKIPQIIHEPHDVPLDFVVTGH